VSIFALNLTTALGLALAIDYTLLMISRFRNELAEGAGRDVALARMMVSAGRTVAFSATTVALSTAVMVRLGRVHGNLMVDVAATNEKLRRRALSLVAQLVPADATRAKELLAAADGSVKVAVVMGRKRLDAPAARAVLARFEGRLRPALEAPSPN